MHGKPLPVDGLKAELARLSLMYGRSAGDGEMSTAWHDGLLCLIVDFRDGLQWRVPFDPEAQAIIEADGATMH